MKFKQSRLLQVLYLFTFLSLLLPVSCALASTPVIIYLKGTCCAGKSTLMQLIEKTHPSIETVDEDAIAYETYEEAVSRKFPLEYESIAHAIAPGNRYHAIRAKDIFFNKTASEADCQVATIALDHIQNTLNHPSNRLWTKAINRRIQQKVLGKMRAALLQAKCVLLDSWDFTANQIQQVFPQTPVIRILLYCDFPAAYQRLLKRNREGIAKENIRANRYVLQLMGSFCSLYQISPKLSPYKIDKEMLNAAFDETALNLQNKKDVRQSIFTYEELSRQQFQKLREDFTSPFKEGCYEHFYIVPKEKQDLIIDNTYMETQQMMDSLIDFMQEYPRQEHGGVIKEYTSCQRGAL